MNAEEVEKFLMENITPEDVSQWHEGELTPHLRTLLERANCPDIQIWGSHDGPEPLSIIVHCD